MTRPHSSVKRTWTVVACPQVTDGQRFAPAAGDRGISMY
jgi:hypothetical protein